MDSAGGLIARANRDRLAQILDNYLSNARYAPEDTVVIVCVEAVTDEVRLSVIDAGPLASKGAFRLDPLRAMMPGPSGRASSFWGTVRSCSPTLRMQ